MQAGRHEEGRSRLESVGNAAFGWPASLRNAGLVGRPIGNVFSIYRAMISSNCLWMIYGRSSESIYAKNVKEFDASSDKSNAGYGKPLSPAISASNFAASLQRCACQASRYDARPPPEGSDHATG
jgi:hypothetical protein